MPQEIMINSTPREIRVALVEDGVLQDLLIEPTSGRVSGPGVEAHLKPKAVEVLLYLAARPLELVEREELLQAVWGEDAGSSEALTHAVSELRSCCHDHANSPSLIQTVRGRGYRLLEQPRFVEEPDAATGTGVFQSPDEGSFIGNLMRRGVVQAGAAYMVFSWLLIQVADAVTPTLNLPAWFPAVITYAAIGGFPIVLVFAWMSLELRHAFHGTVVGHHLETSDAEWYAYSVLWLAFAALLFGAGVVLLVDDPTVRADALADQREIVLEASLPS